MIDPMYDSVPSAEGSMTDEDRPCKRCHGEGHSAVMSFDGKLVRFECAACRGTGIERHA